MRLAVDTGGTFTDLVIEDERGFSVYKRPTVADDPVQGILDVLGAAAAAREMTREQLLAASGMFIHATTHPLNALLTNRTARTALLTSRGHPDVLVLREGGRGHFNVRAPYPAPYVPRSLTFEIDGRMTAEGDEAEPFDEDQALDVIGRLKAAGVDAVAVCLLWSIVDASHETRLGELLGEQMPGTPYTLSHRLSPTLREYRRAVASSIDASLKRMMNRYLSGLIQALDECGFGGRLLMVSSSGGLLDADDVLEAPIHSIKSGPAMAPIAGRWFASRDLSRRNVIVADTGGTSYDVSVVRNGEVPWTRESWVGKPHLSPMTGFPSVDVGSSGAGGGSIAWVDEGGLLHVGPQSAGADPGPAAYGRGGREATVTDAAIVLGLLDPADFLGGELRLDPRLAEAAIARSVAEPLGLDVAAAAVATMDLMTEQMVRAIEDTVIRHGVDPRESVLVGGGGAAGLNVIGVARRIGVPHVLIPESSAVLSASGALLSDLAADFRATCPTRSSRFDDAQVERVLAELEQRAKRFVESVGSGVKQSGVEFFAEAHYPREVWEIEVPFEPPLATPEDIEQLERAFHDHHERLYAVADRGADVEIVSWRVRAWARLAEPAPKERNRQTAKPSKPATRVVHFPAAGPVETTVYEAADIAAGQRLEGPAIISSPVTTTVIDPGAVVRCTDTGGLLISPWAQSLPQSETGRLRGKPMVG